MRNVINSHKPQVSSISLLYEWANPSQIAFFIISISVLSIKCQFGRWFTSYLCKKFFKGIEKKLNTTTPVAIIIFIVGIITTLFSTLKCFVFRRMRLVDRCFTVSASSITNPFTAPAPAGNGSFHFQTDASNRLNYAADAFTPPVSNIVGFTCISQNGQMGKNLMSQITKWISAMTWCWNGFKDNARIKVGHNISFSPNIVIKVVRASNLCQPFYIVPQPEECT